MRATKKGAFVLALFLVLIGGVRAEECTTGLAHAAATANGKTLLWKNRDSSNRPNAVHLFNCQGTKFLGLINAADTTQVWAGINQYGLAIMNAEALDMAVPGETTGYDEEGLFMKACLAQLRSVEEFAAYLDSTNQSGRKVTSNFGVIDAAGKAAFFETGNHEYFRFDATPDSAGYAVRANFAFHARSTEGYGHIRYQRALDLFTKAVTAKDLTAEYIIKAVACDIYLPETILVKERKPSGQLRTRETVNRYRTVACAVFESIPGKPELTTFWMILGEPAVALAVPLWVSAGAVPELIDSAGYSKLNERFTQIRRYVYPDTSFPAYLDPQRLLYIRRQLMPVQQRIFLMTRRKLTHWQRRPPQPQEMSKFQDAMVSVADRAARKLQQKLQKKYARD
jgi:hypothetical protein